MIKSIFMLLDLLRNSICLPKLDLFQNLIRMLKLPFLAPLSTNFSTIYAHIVSKFVDKGAQKSSIFSSKANFERGLFLMILACSACNRSDSPPQQEKEWQIILGRNERDSLLRPAIYRALVPKSWIRKDRSANESVYDTTKALCEFEIDHRMRITIHNFPAKTIEDRIPPASQIARWQRQFDALDPLESQIIPISFNGFSGFYLKAVGVMKGEKITVLAWSMQIAPEHFYHLSGEDPNKMQMRSDFTIKAQGPSDLIKENEMTLREFAKSFELIEEIPSE